MIIAFTGHRPPKAGLTYSHKAEGDWAAVNAVRAYLREHRPEFCITGGALGFDTLAARACVYEQVPFKVYVPCQGHSSRWPQEAQLRYQRMLELASEVKLVTDARYSAWAMMRRNEAMVDHANMVLAWWDGTPGGTKNCIDYAEQQGKTVRSLYFSSAGPDVGDGDNIW
jgi:uncharacterized phage-like protein YoqJ